MASRGGDSRVDWAGEVSPDFAGLDRDALLQGLRGLTLSLHALIADLPRGSQEAQRLAMILCAFDGLLAQAQPDESVEDLREGPRELALRLRERAEASHGSGRPRLVLKLRGEGRGRDASPRASRLIADLVQLWLQPMPGLPSRERLMIDLWWLEPALFLCVSASAQRLALADSDHLHQRLEALGGHMRLEKPRRGRARLTLALPAARAYRQR